MKKMMFLSKNWYFSVQKALIYYTFNKSHLNSFNLIVIPHVANFRYVANFRFVTLYLTEYLYVARAWPKERSDYILRNSGHILETKKILNFQKLLLSSYLFIRLPCLTVKSGLTYCLYWKF